ncbi:MAG: UTP--glucose-1-phosphate uridylyltransferase, partial [Kiritimatiellae bacterium]|nr:UTP--glucose-1-phosphate uridylyltransferase [Kiritimatiellia bacterium]
MHGPDGLKLRAAYEVAMTYPEALALLRKYQQSHLLDFWQTLAPDQQHSLLAQIETLDWKQVARMREMLSLVGRVVERCAIRPAAVVSLSGLQWDMMRRKGEEAITNGEVAVLLVAGGQGSRLGFEGPKGCFPIGPLSRAPLFWFHARKILAFERKYAAQIPFYIMTSEANDSETRTFFEHHKFFGLCPERVIFFRQGMWPALWPDGRIVLERPDRIFMSPDGHGGVLAAMDRTGILNDMIRRGITTLFYFQVDNPLVNVADPVFVGLHRERNADVSLKVCVKRDAWEPLGVFVEENGKPAIVEYSELSDKQKTERTPDGLLKFRFGSVAIHVFSLDFLRREVRQGLPLHLSLIHIS